MILGLGVMELLLVLGVLAAPVVLVVLAVRLLSGRGASLTHLLVARNRELEGEVRATGERLEGMEARLLAMEEKLAFTTALLESGRGEG